MFIPIKPKIDEKVLVGWREWCSLPVLGLPAVKAKIDTGARTSALHAFEIEQIEQDGKPYVRFCIHPLQRHTDLVKACIAPLVDRRPVKTSSGKKEHRFVIKTPIQIGNNRWEIEITLTNRRPMRFRMLLGREALRKRMVVDPGRSYYHGKILTKQLLVLYSTPPASL